MKRILLIALFIFPLFVKAQKTDTSAMTPTDTTKFFKVDVEPEFPGGLYKLFLYIQKNEKDHDNNGIVRVSFVVEKDGSLSNIQITQSLSDSTDKEAIRLITQSPKWIPGMQRGRPVRVRYSIPINFPAR